MNKPGWRLLAVTSLAGVRGALTLSAVMTLPLTFQDGSPFPVRDLAILLAAGVIVLSLLAAHFGLPRFMKGIKLPPETAHEETENRVRLAAAHAAIAALERFLGDRATADPDDALSLQAGGQILMEYRQRIEAREKTGEDDGLSPKTDEIERRLRLVALRAERDELYRIARSGASLDEVTQSLVREVDLQEARFAMR